MSGNKLFFRYTQNNRTHVALSDSCCLSSGSTYKKGSMKEHRRQHRYCTSLPCSGTHDHQSLIVQHPPAISASIGLPRMPQGSRKSRISCYPTGNSLAGSSRENVQAKQSGHQDLSTLPKSLVQMISDSKLKVKWCTIVLKPHVLIHMQWHIF